MAAGPSVVVRVLGDVGNFAKSLTGAGATGASAAQKIHAGFSSMLNTLNQTGILGPFSGALSSVNDAIDQIAEHGKSMTGVMLGVGGAMTGVGAVLSEFGSKEKASHQQLQAAVAATGHSYEEYGKAIEAAIKHEENYGHTSEQTQDALRALTEATHDPAKALQMLGLATDLAAAKHEDLATAAGQIGKVYNGNTKLLKEFGVTVDKTTHLTKDHKTATEALAGVLKGQASAAASTFAGRIDAIKTKIEDQVSMFGQKYGPALQMAGVGIMALASIMEIAGPIMAAAEALPLLPILAIVAAIGVLAVAAYAIYKNWDTIWAAMKRIIEDVWQWIVKNWPYLVGVITGPIGLAAAWLYKHWDTVKKDAKAVVDWIVNIWNGLVGFFAGIPARLYAVASGAWQFLYGEAAQVWGWISGVWNVMVGWVGGLPGRIWGAMTGMWGFIYREASGISGAVVNIWNGLLHWVGGMPGAIARVTAGMWNGITQAFRGAIDALIDIWNSLHFTIGGWKVGPFTTPKVTVGMPYIPHLAQGGLITTEGLVYAHAGEVITPAPETAKPRGPVVHIEHAAFAKEIDVEAFMRRVAWVATTKAI